jgi:hypothetical protein
MMLAGLLFIPLSDEARLIRAVRQIPKSFFSTLNYNNLKIMISLSPIVHLFLPARLSTDDPRELYPKHHT